MACVVSNFIVQASRVNRSTIYGKWLADSSFLLASDLVTGILALLFTDPSAEMDTPVISVTRKNARFADLADKVLGIDRECERDRGRGRSGR